MMNRIDQDQEQPRRSQDESNTDVRPSGVASGTGSFREREGERSSGGGGLAQQQHLPQHSFLIDSALIHQLSGAPPLLQQYSSLQQRVVQPMHSDPLRYLNNMGNSALPFGRLQQGQLPSAQHPTLLHGGSGVSHLLEELGVQHLVEQERQHLLAQQSTLVRQDIPAEGDLSGDVGSAHSRLWSQAGSTDPTTTAEAEGLAAAGKSSKKKQGVKKPPPPIPRPSRLPCRARGMPEDHDYNSAYFDVAPDTKHGDGLVCSFPSCRNDGIKFLYCDHCRDAVGKRVFRNQHHHMDDDEAPLIAAGVKAHTFGGNTGDILSSNDSSPWPGGGTPHINDMNAAVLSKKEEAPPAPSTASNSAGGKKKKRDEMMEEGSRDAEDSTAFIPCRARGMPKEHDYKSAYFLITRYTEHGNGLVCSFAECRNTGVKFRYCIFCQDAVARRNFKHHHHKDDLLLDEEEQTATNIVISSGTAVAAAVPPMVEQSKAVAAADAEDSSSSAAEENNRDLSSSLAYSSTTSPGPEITGRASSMEEAHVQDPLLQPADLKPSRKRIKAWTALLTKRPRSNEGYKMAKWLEKVKAISDFDNIPVNAATGEEASSESSSSINTD